MASDLGPRGYYSLLRWRNDVTRDEARNVAVVLVDEFGRFGGVRAAPLSTISPSLHEQGLLDAMLVRLEQRFAGRERPKLEDLARMHESLHRSLYVTEPRPVAAPDADVVLDALYRAYAMPRGGGVRVATKGVVLDRAVAKLREFGWGVRRGEYVGDFLFDIVIDSPPDLPSLVEVLSFAPPRKNWSPVEHDAGHFLYALEKVKRTGMAVVEPPSEASYYTASAAHERVLRWFDGAGVPVVESTELAEKLPSKQRSLPLGALNR